MENASKALLIAAAILVVIILIAVGMKIYSSTTDTQKVAMDTGKTISDKTGEATGLATDEITGNKIKYFEEETETKKDKKDVVPGDTIKIGTEKFMIFSTENNQIKAMPYYNLKLDSNPIRQATEETDNLSVVHFEVYNNTTGNDNIDISNTGMQKKIMAYKETLEGLGAVGIEVRVGRYKEDFNEGKVKGKKINPGQSSSFWLGSGHPTGTTIMYILRFGDFHWDAWSSAGKGIRPIIIIPK